MVHRVLFRCVEVKVIKNRIHLGSKLDVGKFADSLEQLSSSDISPAALTIDVSSVDQCWLQVTLANRTSEAPNWIVVLGYPSETAPIQHFQQLGLDLPDSFSVTEWTPDLSASLAFKYSENALELAEFLHAVIVKLHKLDTQSDIDLALEYG